MAMPLRQHYTADMVRAMPDDGNRYETVHGELLVSPAPRATHQQVVKRLLTLLVAYLGPDHDGDVLMSPADISFDADTLVQPDVFVGDLARTLETGRWSDIGKLYLVIEVLSPGTARADRFVKRRLYQQEHIPEYWIVDGQQRCVEVWTPQAVEPRIERERLLWRHPSVAESCVVDLNELFRRP
jgi:Uma2 family endonuclease